VGDIDLYAAVGDGRNHKRRGVQDQDGDLAIVLWEKEVQGHGNCAGQRGHAHSDGPPHVVLDKRLQKAQAHEHQQEQQRIIF
jgi:hypothetical protein